MKRSEFIDIVNDVMREEDSYLTDRLNEIQFKNNALPAIIAMYMAELPGVAARAAGKIIEKAGLIHFDADD